MISTIFYFCPTEAEYQRHMDIADISTSTIVFVEDSRSIYMNGKRYGQALGYVTEDEFNTEVGSTNLRFTAFGNSLQQVAA
jgi:hypothetical protein